MKRILLTFAATLLVCYMGFAKEPKQPESYNYQRGLELILSDQVDEGIASLKKELHLNPKNGYAYVWIAAAYTQKDEKGTALHFAEEALKYLPKSDKYHRAWTYVLQGRLYLAMADTLKALSYFTQAIKTEPKNKDWYKYRGALYHDMQQWEQSDADFRRYIKLAPGSCNGYLYLSRNMYYQEKYEEALKLRQYAHKLVENALTYSAMAEVEMVLGRYEEATEHIIESLKLEPYEETCVKLMQEYKDAEFLDLLREKFHTQNLANPNVLEWYAYTEYVQRAQKEYEDAIRTCKKIRAITADTSFDYITSELYSSMGDWENALTYANKAIEGDSTDIDFRCSRANTYSEMDSVALMYADMDYLLQQYPDNAQLYFERGRMNLFRKRYEEAIEDYSNGLAFESGNHMGRYMRGRCYEAIGRTDKANKDYLRIESATKRPEVLMFVKASLGKKEEALALADSVLKVDTTEYRYNVACVYALLGEKELALSELEKELQAGFVRFQYLRLDPDLQSLSGDELENLIWKYESIAKERIRKFNEVENGNQDTERVVEIPFTIANGVTKADCTINGLPLNFIFDTLYCFFTKNISYA